MLPFPDKSMVKIYSAEEEEKLNQMLRVAGTLDALRHGGVP